MSSASSVKTGLSVKNVGGGPYAADREEQLRATSAGQVASGGRLPSRPQCTANPCCVSQRHGCPAGRRCQEPAVTFANAPLGQLCRDCHEQRLQDALTDREMRGRYTRDQLESPGTPSVLDTLAQSHEQAGSSCCTIS